nr:hypothetical protein GCM10020093_051320 [Planobispora longispora]
MAAWDEVRDIIDIGDEGGLVARMAALTGDERREVARELPGYAAVLRERAEAEERAREAELETLNEWDDRWFEMWNRTEPWDNFGELLRIAGAGSLGGAAAVAAWLARRDLRMAWPSPDGAARRAFGDPGPVVEVLSRRPPEWQAEVAVRLARKIRDARDPGRRWRWPCSALPAPNRPGTIRSSWPGSTRSRARRSRRTRSSTRCCRGSSRRRERVARCGTTQAWSPS